MSRRSYPELRSASSHESEAECCACDRPAVGSVRIAWDYMRGNDSSEPVCQRHMSMANDYAQFRRFIAHMNTKEDFVGQ